MPGPKGSQEANRLKRGKRQLYTMGYKQVVRAANISSNGSWPRRLKRTILYIIVRGTEQFTVQRFMALTLFSARLDHISFAYSTIHEDISTAQLEPLHLRSFEACIKPTCTEDSIGLVSVKSINHR